jgi:hypothetical protein
MTDKKQEKTYVKSVFAVGLIYKSLIIVSKIIQTSL